MFSISPWNQSNHNWCYMTSLAPTWNQAHRVGYPCDLWVGMFPSLWIRWRWIVMMFRDARETAMTLFKLKSGGSRSFRGKKKICWKEERRETDTWEKLRLRDQERAAQFLVGFLFWLQTTYILPINLHGLGYYSNSLFLSLKAKTPT